MKKIINGKVYDTETATEVATWANAGSWRDFNHIEETLYRKKTGEYFLHGEGGPSTRYAKQIELNSWSGGSKLIPLSYKQATEWAEEHLDGDEYEEIFGGVQEDDSKKVVAYSLTGTAIDTLRRMSEQEGVSASEILERLIAQAAK